MKAVGIKILKARLSEYIRLVKNGETVLVTDRDEVVAELRPAHRQNVQPHTLKEILEEMSDKGLAVLASESIKTWKWDPKAVPPSKISSQDILDELRKDSGE